jgi:hypothetical protein
MHYSTSQPTGAAIPLTAEHLAALQPCSALLAQIAQLLLAFPTQPVTPAATQTLETDLQHLLREVGRTALEHTFNALEPADPEQVSAELTVGGDRYRRREKSPQMVDSTFGSLCLCRWLYESRTPGEPCLFPLEHLLGLVAGRATPALADRVGQLSAQHPQRTVLRVLREDHALKWSHALLRKVAAAAAGVVSGQRHAAQVKQVIAWLRQAQKSRGPFEPVLAVGRDGIMTPLVQVETYKEASVATVSVYDRTGRRLGTVYLGCVPEALQGTLSRQLTALLKDVLAGWKGRRPRLAYITDGGQTPEAYYNKVLRKMTDPCRPGERLAWVRVLDYYHATQYISKLAEALFVESWRATRWARRMRRTLKEWGGLTRVLQSASYYRNEEKLRGKRQKAFAGAYNYLWKRRKHMNYAALKAQGVPIGSGVTEAGCKVVVTQRLKCSGMKWKKPGAQVVLDLRVVWLSGVWEQAWKAHLEGGVKMNLHTYAGCLASSHAAAA